MGFTHECILNKNTPEIRKRLEEIGRKYSGYFSKVADGSILCSSQDFITINEDAYKRFIEEYPESFNCGTNEELFLAIAGMRDDTDYLQYFVSEKDHHGVGLLIPKGSVELCFMIKNLAPYYHKATVEELIKHFKR